MTERDPYAADKIAAQAELGRLLAPHAVTADELAGRPIPDPHRPVTTQDQESIAGAGQVEQVSLQQLPGETPDEFRRRVPEAAGPQPLPDGFGAV